jgi:xanthine dehydrogenase YagS FAD-binding subunit
MWNISIDEPRSFELLSPSSIDAAVQMASQYGTAASFLAGGCDLLDQMKHQWNKPRAVINLKTIPGLKNLMIEAQSIKLGSLMTLGAIERNADLMRLVPALVKAATRVATPQIRNAGTLGGNLLQDSRCSYYRGPWYCYRAGGIVCDAYHGINTEHALFGGDRCYTVSPSDCAPALVALEAMVRIRGPRGDRTQLLSDLFVGPAENITVMHRLQRDEILTEIEIPRRANQRSTFVKYAMRSAWDFALASVAVALTMEAGRATNCRILLGGIAPLPWRSYGAEQAIDGRPLDETTIENAANSAIEGAKPLAFNEYKVGLVKKLVRTALTELMQ